LPESKEGAAMLRVLVIEDTGSEWALIKAMLPADKYELNWAEDGNAAIEYIETRKPYDLALVDMNFPMKGINQNSAIDNPEKAAGHAMIKRIRKLYPETKIIGMSGDSVHGGILKNTDIPFLRKTKDLTERLIPTIEAMFSECGGIRPHEKLAPIPRFIP
jgi:CheY-like chemotaxis protein